MRVGGGARARQTTDRGEIWRGHRGVETYGNKRVDDVRLARPAEGLGGDVHLKLRKRRAPEGPRAEMVEDGAARHEAARFGERPLAAVIVAIAQPLERRLAHCGGSGGGGKERDD